MPERYEAIRDYLVSKGMSVKAAKGKAAKIYNGTKKEGEPKLSNKHRQTTEQVNASVARRKLKK